MGNRLRWKLTAFNTVITGAILLGMTLLCLFISERNTRAQTFQNFSGNLSTVSSYLEVQNQLSDTWMRQMESSGRFSLSIQDGGTPLFSMGLSAERNNLAPEFQQARERAVSEFALSAVSARNGGSCAFSLRGEDGAGYFAGVSLIPKNDSVLELILLYPLNEMENGIHRQRMVVCIAALVAVALLGAFSWCFTGEMLRPIQENQQRQAQFIAAASHELRTPLTAILAGARLLERASLPEEKRTQLLSSMAREAQRLSDMDERLLQLTRMEHGGVQMEAFSSIDMAREALSIFEGVELHGEDAVFTAERELTIQLLRNLVVNAQRAGGDEPVAVTLMPDGFSVTDRGCGMTREQVNRAFEPFYKADKARTRSAGGAGLGLTLCQKIAQLHHGSLTITSEPGRGTTVVYHFDTTA